MLTAKPNRKIARLSSMGQTHKIILLTDLQNIPKVQYGCHQINTRQLNYRIKITLAYIVISMGKVELGVVPHLQSGVITDETVPVMPKIELLVSGT